MFTIRAKSKKQEIFDDGVRKRGNYWTRSKINEVEMCRNRVSQQKSTSNDLKCFVGRVAS